MSLIGKGKHIMVILFLVLLGSLITALGVLLAWSPGKAKPFLDKEGRSLKSSISEKIYVKINGAEQGMFIKGKDKTKPVLLFVHGGPAMPEYAISRKYPAVLENDFVVCWWEQRGAGLSYSKDIDPKTLTTEQLISDTLEVTQYLSRRFGQEKIYLMGHSWGSFIGIQAAARAPELYYAYIGMGQVSRQLQSEKIAYNYMAEQFREAGDSKMLKKLESYPVNEMDTLPAGYQTFRDAPMHRLGIGTTHTMRSVMTGIVLPVMQNPEYTLGEKINIWRAKFFINRSTHLWDEMMAADLTKQIQKLDVPVYFCDGIYDYSVSYIEAKAFFKQLKAPVKGFYTFHQSAHSPLFEEPEKFSQIVKEDILRGTSRLSSEK